MLFKIDALKNFANHKGKKRALEPCFNRTARSQAPSFIKTRLQQRCPLAFILQNTSDDSFWRGAKYDLSLKARGQFPYSRAKAGGIILNK